MPENSEKKINIYIIISVYAVIILTAAAFFPSLGNDFTNWDDSFYVYENSSIRDLSLNNLKTIFSSFYVSNYQPVTILTYALEYKIFKLSPMGYHTTNLVFHILNSLLVLYMVYLLSRNIFISFFVSVMFGIHPMHVESVAWIAERKDVLSTFFFVLSIVFFLRYSDNKKKVYYILSMAAFILSLLSKPMGVTLPFILHLTDYLKIKNNSDSIEMSPLKNFINDIKVVFKKENYISKIPFWIVSFVFIILTIATQGSTGAILDVPSYSSFRRILVGCYGIIFYIHKLFLPVNLSAYYPYPENFFNRIPLFFYFTPLISAIILAITFYLNRISKSVVFGMLFYIFTILPVLQIIPVGGAIVADRYSYIPYIGLLYMVSVLLYSFYINVLVRYKTGKIIFYLFLILFLSANFYLTFNRCKIWKDSITLWNDVISKYQTIPVAYNNRGLALGEKKKYKEAIDDFNKAIKLKDDYELAFNNRGNIFFILGKYDLALSDFNKTIEIKPDYAQAYFNRGTIFFRVGQHSKAISDFNKAINLDPNYIRAYNNRGLVYGVLGDYEKAISDFKKAIEIDPYGVFSHNNLGVAYSNMKRYNDAIAAFSKSIEINPLFADAYKNRAEAYIKIGNKTEADKDIQMLNRLK